MSHHRGTDDMGHVCVQNIIDQEQDMIEMSYLHSRFPLRYKSVVSEWSLEAPRGPWLLEGHGID